MKGLIKIQNDDDESFRWYLVSYLNTVNKNPAEIRSVRFGNKDLVKNYFKISFP